MANVSGSGSGFRSIYGQGPVSPNTIWGQPAGGWELALGAPPTRTDPVIPPAPPAPPAPPGGGGAGFNPYALTADKKRQAANLDKISKFNAGSIKGQYQNKMSGYDMADSQSKKTAETQKKQNSRSAASDRFAQLMRLQSSAGSLINKAGNALEGSQSLNIADMLKSRNDMDSSEYFSTLFSNQSAVNNALYEALANNALSRNEAASEAEFQLRSIEADNSAQRNNIHQKLFVAPGSGKSNLGSAGFASSRRAAPVTPTLSGYYTQAPQIGSSAQNVNSGSSYFDQLMNGYNRR